MHLQDQSSRQPSIDDLEKRLVEIHDDLVESYDKRLAEQQGLWDDEHITGFMEKCFESLKEIGCCAIVYEQEEIKDGVMEEGHNLRIVVPADHPAKEVNDPNGYYKVYRERVSRLFGGQGDMFRLRKITNPGHSSTRTGEPNLRVRGAYCMPFWIRKRESCPTDLFTLLLIRHFERNRDIHCIPWNEEQVPSLIKGCRKEFEDLLFDLYMPADPLQLCDIFYYPSYNKANLESHMLFAFTGLQPTSFRGIERLCSRIAYLIRKATADDLAYRVTAGSVAARTTCRNFAHNLGSHALFYVSWDGKHIQSPMTPVIAPLQALMTRIQEGQALTRSELLLLLDAASREISAIFDGQVANYQDLLALIDYVRDRGTYQAQVGNTASFWTQSYDLRDQLLEFEKIKLLTRNLCRSELQKPDALRIVIHNVPETRSTLAALSMGKIAVQALYSIIENIAKNTAKYANHASDDELLISVFIEDDERHPDDHRVSIESNRRQDQRVVNQLLGYLEDINFDNRRAEYELLGLTEILVSASFLRRIKPYMIKRYLQPADDRKPPLLEIALSNRPGPTLGSVRYVFFIPKPNIALIASNSLKLLESVRGLGEPIAAKNERDIKKLIKGTGQRIPRHGFLVVDSVLGSEFREWLNDNAAYLPSRWVFASEPEIMGWIEDASSSSQLDQPRFERLVWDRYMASRRKTLNVYMLSGRFKPRTVVRLPHLGGGRGSQVGGGRVVFSQAGDDIPRESIVFLHEYSLRRGQLTGLVMAAGSADGPPKPGERPYRFVDAINDVGWTEPLHSGIHSAIQQIAMDRGILLGSTPLEFDSHDIGDLQAVALYQRIEAAQAHVVVIDERVDQEMSRLPIASKGGVLEPFDEYWAQRNVFRIRHQDFVRMGDSRLAEYFKQCPCNNKPSFVFIHLSLIQRWIKEYSGNEERFLKRAARWSSARIKLIVHSDRGNHDSTGKWKASAATFVSLQEALLAGDKLALVELALAARAPSRERR